MVRLFCLFTNHPKYRINPKNDLIKFVDCRNVSEKFIYKTNLHVGSCFHLVSMRERMLSVSNTFLGAFNACQLHLEPV